MSIVSFPSETFMPEHLGFSIIWHFLYVFPAALSSSYTVVTLWGGM